MLKARGWSAYRLADEAGISLPTAYRLVKESSVGFQRIDVDTLEKLCDVFDVEPGDLLERTSSRRKQRS
ncbi:MAG TPA: helix-turn-helix transcriptional regulator [Polyangiaceae bacterium]|nr:helix-turn-helix transcriptional regulator [Polyangiaceae bacterium]